MKIISAIKHGLAGSLALIALLSAHSAASDDLVVKKGAFDSDVVVTADKLLVEATIAGDLIAAAGEVDVNSVIDGDAFVTGGTIEVTRTIRGGLTIMGGNIDVKASVNDGLSLFAGQAHASGKVRGDVLAMGGLLDFDGDIQGDLRGFGGKIVIRKNVTGKVLTTSGVLRIQDGATITGKATIGAGTAYIGGHITGDVRVGAREVIITGRIDGNVRIAAKTIKVLPSARIGGDLIYHSPDEIQLSDQAEIGGDVTFMQSEGMSEREGGMFALAGATHIILIIGLVLLASAFVLVLPKLFPALDRQTRGRNWLCVLMGLGVLIGGPVLIFLLFLSAIGIPIAILLIAVMFVMIITGQFGSAYVLGRRVISMTRHDATRKPLHRVGATALGLSVLWLLAVVPVLGVIVIVLATARGVGALVFEVVELRTRFGQPVSS